jgi:GntR family transcriptional regulator
MLSTQQARFFKSFDTGAAARPLYRVVKRSLLGAIEQGVCLPGESLPSEFEIARAMGVSIGTLRRAVDELVAEHIVVRRHGLGTFVATHNADRFLFQFFHVERGDGLREAPIVDFISFVRTRADSQLAETLHLRPGEAVIQIENRLRLQGRAVVYDRLTLPSALFKGMSEKHFRGRQSTIYQLYQSDYGISVLRAQERVRATGADRDAVRVLGVGAGQPMIEVQRVALTFGDRPVEHRTSIINTAHHDYVHLLSRPEGAGA